MQKNVLCAYVDCYEGDSPLGVFKVSRKKCTKHFFFVVEIASFQKDYEKLGVPCSATLISDRVKEWHTWHCEATCREESRSKEEKREAAEHHKEVQVMCL